jgi:hypothetical protein
MNETASLLFVGSIAVMFLCVFMLAVYRRWLQTETEAAWQRQVAALQALSARLLAEHRAEAARIVKDANDEISGTRRSAIARVYQAIRHADVAVRQALAERDPLRLARHNWKDLERVMSDARFPTRVCDEVLDAWQRDRENGLNLLDRHLAQHDLDRAFQAVDEARTTALMQELYLSETSATRIRSSLTFMVRKAAELRHGDTSPERRHTLADEIGRTVEALCELLREEATGTPGGAQVVPEAAPLVA